MTSLFFKAATLEKRIALETILQHVAEHFEVTASALRSDLQTRRYTFPRAVAMYLARVLTPLSYPDIGKAFRGRHHTTVMAAVRSMDGHIRSFADTRIVVEMFIRRLAGDTSRMVRVPAPLLVHMNVIARA